MEKIKFENVQAKVDEARENLINFIKQYEGTEVDIPILVEISDYIPDDEDDETICSETYVVRKIEENGITFDTLEWEHRGLFEDYWNLSTNELYTIAHYLNYKM